jgi:predicted anti-sigma-YlaC factor YlaD
MVFSRRFLEQGLLCPVLAAALLSTGCIRKYAINKIGDALAKSGSTFSADDDPDLIQDAAPFSLKLIESLLAETPRHRGLLTAAAGNFTQYAYAFVNQDADEIEDQDIDKALVLRGRARRLYLRARDYGLRGLEVKHRDFGKSLHADPKAAVAVTRVSDVPLLYWTAASWGLAISVSKDQPELVADQPMVEALIDRALELDEDYDFGAIHSFLITYEPSRLAGQGDAGARSRKHFERAMELSGGYLAGPLVSLAESVSVRQQNRQEFQELLDKALAVDVDAKPEWRLANMVSRRRARWLQGRVDQLFVE